MQMNMCLFQLNKAILGPAGIAVRSCPWTLAAAHRSRCFSLNLVKAGAEGCPEFRSPYTEFVLSGNLCVNRIRRTLASHWLYKVVRIGNLALDSIKYYLLWWSTLVGWCWWIHNTEQNYLVYLVYLVCLPGFCSSRKMISCQLGLKTQRARGNIPSWILHFNYHALGLFCTSWWFWWSDTLTIDQPGSLHGVLSVLIPWIMNTRS